MFLKSEAENAVARVETAKQTHATSIKKLEMACQHRFNLCTRIHDVIYPKFKRMLDMIEEAAQQEVTLGIEGLANQSFRKAKDVNSIFQSSIDKFENELVILNNAYQESTSTAGGTAAGVVAGAGIATLAPTGMMAIATTFGTAGTGTAISSLSGAAATNAALAWLGGGTLAAGGGGMSLGSTFVALTGPVGWAIAGVSLIGGGLLYRGKNKKVMEEANRVEEEIVEAIGDVKKKYKLIGSDCRLNEEQTNLMSEAMDEVIRSIMFNGFTESVLGDIQIVIDRAMQLSIYLDKRVALK